jgi:hypothetical protein
MCKLFKINEMIINHYFIWHTIFDKIRVQANKTKNSIFIQILFTFYVNKLCIECV